MWGDGIRGGMSVVSTCDMARTQLHWENTVPPTPTPGHVVRFSSGSLAVPAGGLLMTVNFTGFSLGHDVYRTAVSEEGTDERVQALVPTYASLFTNIP